MCKRHLKLGIAGMPDRIRYIDVYSTARQRGRELRREGEEGGGERETSFDEAPR